MGVSAVHAGLGERYEAAQGGRGQETSQCLKTKPPPAVELGTSSGGGSREECQRQDCHPIHPQSQDCKERKRPGVKLESRCLLHVLHTPPPPQTPASAASDSLSLLPPQPSQSPQPPQPPSPALVHIHMVSGRCLLFISQNICIYIYIYI